MREKKSFKVRTLALAAVMCLSAFTTALPASAATPDEELPGLKDIYQDDFLLGNIYAGWEYGTTQHDTFDRKNFNVITLGNAMKPAYLTSGPGKYNFSGPQRFLDAAAERDMAVHGHVLVWHGQSAPWLNTGATGGTRAQAKANMEEYIKTVCEHYKGQLISWDVLNEFFVNGIDEELPANFNWRDYSRPDTESAWRKSYANGMDASKGETDTDFVYDSFVFARKYDPDTKLFYNDFNLFQPGKADLVVQMVTELNAQYKREYPNDPRLLIEGIGMQSHNYIQETPASSVEDSIKKFIALGTDVVVSELDLHCWSFNKQPKGYADLKNKPMGDYWSNLYVNNADLEKIQAKLYAEYFMVYKKYAKNIDRVTFWGLTDRESWRSEYNPLILNGDYSPKESYYAVADPEGYLANFEVTDKTELNTAIENAKTLKGEVYTEESWNALTAMITRASDVANSPHVLQRSVNLALADLNTAVSNLVLRYIPVTTVTINAAAMNNLRIGSELQLTATVTPDDSTNQAVTWVSSNPNVATVDENGLVTGVKRGVVSIKAISADTNVSSTIIIKVNP